MSFQFGGGNSWIEHLKLHKGKGYTMDQLKAMYAEAKAAGTAPAPGLPHFGPRNKPKRMIGPRKQRVVPKATGDLAANFKGYCGGKTVAKESCVAPCRWTSNNGCVRGYGKQKTEKMTTMNNAAALIQRNWRQYKAPVDQTGGYWW